MNGITKDNISYSTFRKSKNQTELPPRKESNWLIYMHMVRQDIDKCTVLINEELEKSSGRSAYPNYAKGLILRQDGKAAESIECFKICQRLNPSSPQHLKQQGYSLFLSGKIQDAIKKFIEANELSDGKDWEILYRLGQCYLQVREYDNASNYLNNALKLNDKNENIYLKLAEAHLFRGNKEAAIRVYEEGLKNSPSNGDFPVKLSLLSIDNDEKSWKRTLERLNCSLAHHPYRFEVLLAAGALLQEQGHIDLALAKYQLAVQENALSSSLWNNIGLCFLGKKKYLAAIGCLKRAASINVFNTDVSHNLGLINLSMGQFASAALHFSQSLCIARRSHKTPIPLIYSGSKYRRSWIIAQGYLLLAAALNNLGDTKTAKQAHQMAISLETEDPLPVLSYSIFLWENEGKMQPSNQTIKEEIGKLLDEFYRRVEKGKRRVDLRMIEAAKQLKTTLMQQSENSDEVSGN